MEKYISCLLERRGNLEDPLDIRARTYINIFKEIYYKSLTSEEYSKNVKEFLSKENHKKIILELLLKSIIVNPTKSIFDLIDNIQLYNFVNNDINIVFKILLAYLSFDFQKDTNLIRGDWQKTTIKWIITHFDKELSSKFEEILIYYSCKLKEKKLSSFIKNIASSKEDLTFLSILISHIDCTIPSGYNELSIKKIVISNDFRDFDETFISKIFANVRDKTFMYYFKNTIFYNIVEKHYKNEEIGTAQKKMLVLNFEDCPFQMFPDNYPLSNLLLAHNINFFNSSIKHPPIFFNKKLKSIYHCIILNPSVQDCCSICLEPMNKVVFQGICEHMFHIHCIKDIFKNSYKVHNQNKLFVKCPMCRYPFVVHQNALIS